MDLLGKIGWRPPVGRDNSANSDRAVDYDRENPEVAAGHSRRKFLGLMANISVLCAIGPILQSCLNGEEKGAELQVIGKNSGAATAEVKAAALHGGAISPEDDEETRGAYFYGISVMQGLGIAVDVAVATLAMYRKLGSSRSKHAWIFGVGATHILFPILSGTATAGTEIGAEKIGAGEIAQRTLSGAGFLILSKFLYGEMKGGQGDEDIDVIGALDQSTLKYLAALWSVSVDALISGPVKWEQARTSHWNNNDIFTSIVIGGLTVSLVAAAALKGAEMLHSRYGNDGSADVDNRLKRWDQPLLGVEALALNYFGINAVVNGTFKADLNFGSIAALDTAFTAAMYALAKRSGDGAEKEKLQPEQESRL